MKYIIFFVLINFAQYACQSNETQILDSKITPLNPLNNTKNKHIRDIDDCQKPSFANYTMGNRRFISVDDDTFEEYLKTVDLAIHELPKYAHYKNWTPPEQMINDFPTYLSSYDSQNRPIFVSEVGKHQIVKYALGGREMQALVVTYYQYRVYEILKAMAFKSSKENPVHEYIEIIDYEGLKPEIVLNLAVLRWYSKVLGLFKNFALKYRYKTVHLNINPIAEIALSVYRSLTTQRMQKWNSHVPYGTDRAFWVPKLVQMFGKYQLLEKYGGCKEFLPTYVV